MAGGVARGKGTIQPFLDGAAKRIEAVGLRDLHDCKTHARPIGIGQAVRAGREDAPDIFSISSDV